MTKPISTLQVVSTVLGLVKTGIVVTAMMILEFSKMKAAREKLKAAKAENDLEVEKVRNEKDDRAHDVVIDDYLKRKMLQRRGDGNPCDGDQRP